MTLAALDLSVITDGLKRRLSVRNRAALDELTAAVQSAERARSQAAGAGALPPPKPPRKLARRDGRPDTGAVAPAPGEKPKADDELRVKRAAAATGGAARSGGFIPSVPGGAGAGAPVSTATSAGSSSIGARSPIVAKANLAAGSQAAVVKIASFGSGAARAQSLLNYQSDKGELTLERHDGLMITGQRSVTDFAAAWTADDGRAPSNDILQFTARVSGALTAEQAQETLTEALRGHHYAWRLSQHGGRSRVEIVMTAASRERDAAGKLQRIYDNERSMDGLRDRLESAFGYAAKLSEPTWAHGVEGATLALARLTRGGELEAFAPNGRTLKSETERLAAERPNRPPRAASRAPNTSLEIAKSWRPHMRSSAPRDFAHVILSAKPGTDKEAFMDAARSTLAREFTGHEYVFVMHTNREHIHVHAAVRLVRNDGKRLDPKIQDFSRWRDTLASEARQRGIAMENVRRFDQAHAPAYKLKDVKMMERGIAPASVRRRIERVKNREIHRPTRDEGRRRAQDAACQWRGVAAMSARSTLPPLSAGAVRLYRLDSGETRRGALYAADMATAAAYAKASVAARMVYVDVPAAQLSELKPSRTQPGKVFVVPRAISAQSRAIDGAPAAAVAYFQERAESALGERPEPVRKKENGPMRTAETMIEARGQMAETIGKINAELPDDAARAEFAASSRRLLERADEAIELQKTLEKKRADIQGERYVKPEPTEGLGALITYERKGDEIHYHRHDKTGALQTLAFIDTGKQLDIRDWNSRESVNAALKVASEKWETLSITGADSYREMVAQLAAEHGYKITNPEMQGRIAELRAEYDARRATISEAATRENAPRSDDPQRPADRELRGSMPEATKIREEIDRYNDTLAHSDDGRAKNFARGALKRAEARLETFLSKPLEPAERAALATTAAERDLRLEDIKGRVDREAGRETEQAQKAQRANETSPAQSSEQRPYSSQGEAASARDADRSMEDNARREMPADPRQSAQMQNLREQQARVLRQEEEQQRIDRENAERINQELARPRPESEGESR